MKKIITAFTLLAILASCGTSQKATSTSSANKTENTQSSALSYLRQVHDNAVYAKAISASVDVNVQVKDKDINVSGKLQMLRGKVIRITLVPFGLMEAGRIEFTPNYVMIVDRINKQYFELPYADLNVLKESGLSFYALESLFWNELLMPGKPQLTDTDLASFTVDMNASPSRPISIAANKKVTLNWNTDATRALITKAVLGNNQGSINFDYSDFVAMGTKKFPSKLTLSLGKGAEDLGLKQLALSMSRFSNDTNIEEKTSLSNRYTKVSKEQLMQKLGGF